MVLWLLRTRVPESFPTMQVEGMAMARAPLRAVPLYFAAPTGDGLIQEFRFLPWTGELEADMRTTIEALFGGPQCRGVSPWPHDATLQEVFIASDGTAYVNLGASARWLRPRGDFLEWSMVASLTRTLSETFSTVLGVRLLIDGESTGALGQLMPLEWIYQPGMFMGGWKAIGADAGASGRGQR
jgi:hypothetical protein